MAGINLEKCTAQSAPPVLYHNLRRGLHHSNPNIDPEKSCENTYFTIRHEDPIARHARRVREIQEHRPQGRRWSDKTVTMVSLVYDLPVDFPHPDDCREVDRFFRRCLAIQADMCGGWDNVLGGQVHRDEQHEYIVSPSVLAAEGTPAHPGDPPVRRMSRIHMHAQSVPAVDPETITRINGVAPRTKSKRSRAPHGVWFDCNRLITRAWLRRLNRRVQRMALEEFHCRYESSHPYSSSAEVEQLKVESVSKERAESIVAETRERNAEAGRKLAEAEREREEAEKQHAEATAEEARSRARACEIDGRERDLRKREAAFLERVRRWEHEMRVRFVDRLESWLSAELDKAREVFARAEAEGFEAGRADGFRKGVEQGARAMDDAPGAQASLPGSISDAQLDAVRSLKRKLKTDPDLLPSHAGARGYTVEEWKRLPETMRRFLLSQGVRAPQREVEHGRTL